MRRTTTRSSTTTTTPSTTQSREAEEEQHASPSTNIEFRSPRLSEIADSWNKQENQLPGVEDEEKVTAPPPTEVAKGAYHELHPGQYHELNPGQYAEVNPGQDHEINPGQYHEVNPGQYHEVNPGQYHEVNPGQPVAEATTSPQLDVQVDVVKSTDHAKVYNVQSRVDEFIIGEYGTISTANGQTQHGVRYTAVDDGNSGVDPNLIYETLLKYFPMSVKGVDAPVTS